jgi:SAM-dependent methyltransferase
VAVACVFLLAVAVAGLSRCEPDEQERRRIRATFVGGLADLAAHLETGDREALRRAREAFQRVSGESIDYADGPVAIHHPINFEVPLFQRIVEVRLDPSAAAAWKDDPLFPHVLRRLERDDARLLKVHLGGVLAEHRALLDPAFRTEADRPTLSMDENSLHHLILTTRPERWGDLGKKRMELFAPRPGEHVADVGCGAGFFTFRMAPLVGPTGKVLAVDIDVRILEFVREVIAAERVANVEVVPSRPDDVSLAAASVDAVLLTNTFYAIEEMPVGQKTAFWASLRRALRPGARVLICDDTKRLEGLPYPETLRRIRAAGLQPGGGYGEEGDFCVLAYARSE